MHSPLVAFLIFVITLTFVIWQPRGLGVGWSASGGAVVALLVGVVSLHDVWAVTQIVWDATLAFVGIIIISIVLDNLGFFEWGALKMAHLAKGNGKRVFILVILLGAIVSAFFANDGAALILTPVVLEKVRLLKLDAKRTLPFIIAGGFIADTTSLPFVISNLVNIVSADYFHIGFLSYALAMVVPNLVSLLASTAVLYWYFRKDIPEVYDPAALSEPTIAIRHKGMFTTSWIVLGVLLIGYVISDTYHVPVSFVALIIALVFLLAGGRTKVIHPLRVVREAPWSIVIFSIGMYVVIYGLQNVGLTAELGHFVDFTSRGGLFMAVLGTGVMSAILSSIMNNLPSVMIGLLAIHASHSTGLLQSAMVYANVIGCDLGPKMTPIGSLATLLWLHVLRRRGIRITWGQYFKTGIVLTLPTLVVTLAGLAAWMAVVGYR